MTAVPVTPSDCATFPSVPSVPSKFRLGFGLLHFNTQFLSRLGQPAVRPCKLCQLCQFVAPRRILLRAPSSSWRVDLQSV